MTITLRNVKGSALTWNEVDGNFTDLDGRVEAVEEASVTKAAILAALEIDQWDVTTTTITIGKAGKIFIIPLE